MATFQFYFSDLAIKDIEMIVCPNNVHFNELKLSDALEEFSITSRFLCSKKQKSTFFKKISVLSAFFIEL